MTLDNEEQREIILQALNSAPIQGDYKGIREIIPKIDAIVKAVEEASIAE